MRFVCFHVVTLGKIVQPGLVFDVLLCLVLTILCTYARWQDQQTEKEALRRATTQQRLNGLKTVELTPNFKP